jgi:hypothetical protein
MKISKNSFAGNEESEQRDMKKAIPQCGMASFIDH